ncbi:hypothetical protein J6590_001049 [Homalodisca vitripennis]|nr:hypothetical protein J6590_001049 [Homalodisca vitripennis]
MYYRQIPDAALRDWRTGVELNIYIESTALAIATLHTCLVSRIDVLESLAVLIFVVNQMVCAIIRLRDFFCYKDPRDLKPTVSVYVSLGLRKSCIDYCCQPNGMCDNPSARFLLLQRS